MVRNVERDDCDDSGGDLMFGEGPRRPCGADASLMVPPERFECVYRMLGGEGGLSMYGLGDTARRDDSGNIISAHDRVGERGDGSPAGTG